MIPEHIIKGIYKYVLKEGRAIEDLAIFPGTHGTDPFVIILGGWWESGYADPRYIKVQDYINSMGR